MWLHYNYNYNYDCHQTTQQLANKQAMQCIAM